ncbi:hypothetical protein C2845_PM09G24400 [Panicum miliaceum]|uniref:Uncharacterized protein n=1 Tax=Panicum miliaceum TaxID=4540 RepID=A0A3L6RZN3_PANMI|nr:hypothetical protein C2845_PM09G24400 [Panicum miliaceum]
MLSRRREELGRRLHVVEVREARGSDGEGPEPRRAAPVAGALGVVTGARPARRGGPHRPLQPRRHGVRGRAGRRVRALLSRRHGEASEEEELDARVAALVRMLVGKGKAGMVSEALAEFSAICNHLLPPPARHAY